MPDKVKERFVKKMARGTGVILVGLFVGKILGFALEVLIGRSLGPASYGMYVLGITVISLIRPFSLLGIDSVLVKFGSRYNAQQELGKLKGAIFGSALVVLVAGPAFAIALFFSSDVIASKVFSKPELASVLRILAVSLPLYAIMMVIICSARAFQRFSYDVCLREFIQPLTNLVLVILLLCLGLGIKGVLYGMVASLAITTSAGFLLMRRIWPNYALCEKVTAEMEFGGLLRCGVPLLLASISGTLLAGIDKMVIGYFLTDQSVGIYSAAAKPVRLVAMPLVGLQLAFAPMISELYSTGNTEMLRLMFQTVTRWLFTMTLPFVLLIALFSPEILAVLFGSAYAGGASIMAILAMAFLFDTFAGPACSLLQMCEKHNLDMANNAIAVVVCVILNVIFVNRFGILGAAWATVITVAALNIARFVEVRLIFGMKLSGAIFMRPVLAGFVAVALPGALRYFGFFQTSGFWILGLMFLLVYIVVIVLLGLENSDKVVLNAVVRKVSGSHLFSCPGKIEI